MTTYIDERGAPPPYTPIADQTNTLPNGQSTTFSNNHVDSASRTYDVQYNERTPRLILTEPYHDGSRSVTDSYREFHYPRPNRSVSNSIPNRSVSNSIPNRSVSNPRPNRSISNSRPNNNSYFILRCLDAKCNRAGLCLGVGVGIIMFFCGISVGFGLGNILHDSIPLN